MNRKDLAIIGVIYLMFFGGSFLAFSIYYFVTVHDYAFAVCPDSVHLSSSTRNGNGIPYGYPQCVYGTFSTSNKPWESLEPVPVVCSGDPYKDRAVQCYSLYGQITLSKSLPKDEYFNAAGSPCVGKTCSLPYMPATSVLNP